MIKEHNYISIREILSRILRHPLLQNTSLEQVVQYTVDFIGTLGMSSMYKDEEKVLKIENYRAMLPCDLVSIIQVKDCKSGVCLRSMTSSFSLNKNNSELTFKTQGTVLYTSFKTGEVLLSYKSIPTDCEGMPLLIDNPKFLKALEAYIKNEVFTILFDEGKISPAVLQNTQQRYAWLAGQLQSEFNTPSISEMESIKNSWCTLIQRTNEFNKGFSELGNREMLKI
jgi:hypothetical protein